MRNNLTLTVCYILLACWVGFVGAAVAHKEVASVPTTIGPIKADPNSPFKPKPVWV